jgi:hypothetical protein
MHIREEEAMAITFTRLTNTFAAGVHGVDIAAGVHEADFADIVRLFNDYSVLVFGDPVAYGQ